MTSAWNTLFQGYKRWVLFPPHLPKSIVKGKQYIPPGEEDEAITYFAKVLPKIILNEGEANLQPIHFVQQPGETVFVPGGWWHAVLNVADSIAVTQNVMDSINFDDVWRSVRKERKKFSCLLLSKFKECKDSTFYDRCSTLNTQDQFVMHSDRPKNNKRKQESPKSSAETEQILDIISKKRFLSDDETSNSSSSSDEGSSSSD